YRKVRMRMTSRRNISRAFVVNWYLRFMNMAPKTPRGIIPLNGSEWSGWHKAIRSKPSAKYIKRGQGQAGYRKKNMEVPDGDCPGIYEWRIIMPSKVTNDVSKNSTKSEVVYVGSTCREKEGSLNDRIQEYCNNGSHKEILFNKHIRLGYDIWYRTKPAGNKQQAEGMENKLLDSYNYSWNVRRN
ncbi:hypothetical protein AC249_AIPGENE7380, partial [Exaiptasia diaphana]